MAEVGIETYCELPDEHKTPTPRKAEENQRDRKQINRTLENKRTRFREIIKISS